MGGQQETAVAKEGVNLQRGTDFHQQLRSSVVIGKLEHLREKSLAIERAFEAEFGLLTLCLRPLARAAASS